MGEGCAPLTERGIRVSTISASGYTNILTMLNRKNGCKSCVAAVARSPMRFIETEEILTTDKTGSVTFYTASRSETYLLEKKLYNIKQIFQSGLINYLKIELSNPAIILFGSRLAKL